MPIHQRKKTGWHSNNPLIATTIQPPFVLSRRAQITYGQALAAAFVEGWIFFFISISGLRGRIVQAMPKAIMLATAGGIGIFLSFIGLQGAEGLGIVTYEPATLVTLGGCAPSERTHMYSIGDTSAVCSCDDAGQPNTPNLGERHQQQQQPPRSAPLAPFPQGLAALLLASPACLLHASTHGARSLARRGL